MNEIEKAKSLQELAHSFKMPENKSQVTAIRVITFFGGYLSEIANFGYYFVQFADELTKYLDQKGASLDS